MLEVALSADVILPLRLIEAADTAPVVTTLPDFTLPVALTVVACT
jgi:hypothetical protein